MEYTEPVHENIIQQQTTFCDSLCDRKYIQHVGYSPDNECLKSYFSPQTVEFISKKITQLLQGVDCKNRRIIVPKNTICSIMSSVYENYRPQTGDIFTRYIIPNNQPENFISNMIDQVIEIITTQVRNEWGMRENNAKLTIWTTVYGDFNEHGLRQHPPIKILEKRPNPMEFNMNY